MAIQYRSALDRTFRSLGDETRRRILSKLASEGSCSANELWAPFDVAQPTVSRHLKVLERSGLVTREVDGRTHRFQVEMAPINDAEDWLARHAAFWHGTMQRLENYLDGMRPEDEL